MTQTEKAKDVGKLEDFRRAVEAANVETIVLPASGITVRLCRPPVFAALALGCEGNELQNKITGVEQEQVRSEDIATFMDWVTTTLSKLFVEPRFSAKPGPGEIGLGDVLAADVKFIFRWLRGEVFLSPSGQEDLGAFRGESGVSAVSGASGEAVPVPPK